VSQVFRQDTALPGTHMYDERAFSSHIPTLAARRSAEAPPSHPRYPIHHPHAPTGA